MYLRMSRHFYRELETLRERWFTASEVSKEVGIRKMELERYQGPWHSWQNQTPTVDARGLQYPKEDAQVPTSLKKSRRRYSISRMSLFWEDIIRESGGQTQHLWPL
jgi:hypothetical protein